MALGRWLETTVRDLGIQVVLGAVITGVEIGTATGSESVELATRYGDVDVAATGFVDASGDARWPGRRACPAGCRSGRSTARSRRSSSTSTRTHRPDPEEMAARARRAGRGVRADPHDGLAFFFPGRGTSVLNMTHIEAPLDPVRASEAQLDGRTQADRALAFLREEYPKAFGNARVRAYGFPGRRQTRWIKGRHQLTIEEVRAGTRVR